MKPKRHFHLSGMVWQLLHWLEELKAFLQVLTRVVRAIRLGISGQQSVPYVASIVTGA